MPGLVRGVARTAVIAGTATHVSNNVSRRQANKWAEQDAQQAPPPAAVPGAGARRRRSRAGRGPDREAQGVRPASRPGHPHRRRVRGPEGQAARLRLVKCCSRGVGFVRRPELDAWNLRQSLRDDQPDRRKQRGQQDRLLDRLDLRLVVVGDQLVGVFLRQAAVGGRLVELIPRDDVDPVGGRLCDGRLGLLRSATGRPARSC